MVDPNSILMVIANQYGFIPRGDDSPDSLAHRLFKYLAGRPGIPDEVLMLVLGHHIAAPEWAQWVRLGCPQAKADVPAKMLERPGYVGQLSTEYSPEYSAHVQELWADGWYGPEIAAEMLQRGFSLGVTKWALDNSHFWTTMGTQRGIGRRVPYIAVSLKPVQPDLPGVKTLLVISGAVRSLPLPWLLTEEAAERLGYKVAPVRWLQEVPEF